MRAISIQVPGSSSTVAKVVEQLKAAGANASYNGPVPRGALVVRWGIGGPKLTELGYLTRAGVPTPRYSSEPVRGWLPRRMHHAEAKDFTNPPTIGDFYTEPVFTNHEFRVHVIHDFAFRTQYKALPEGTRALVYNGVPIRNHSLGWKFDPNPHRRFTEATLNLMRDTSRAAVRAMGYDMGAVDVGLIVGSNGHIPDRAVVFEVNTRPSMDEYTRQAYVDALLQLAR